MFATIFLFISIIAIATTRGSIAHNIGIFNKGAGHPDLLIMIWIFLLAGAFTGAGREMGAIDAAVRVTLNLLPSTMILPGLFLAACLVSLSVGTSVGTIAALVPMAAGLSATTGLSLPLITASVVGGSFFGDNLSFISDTTIVATRSQGVKLKDKFYANLPFALPAALITFTIYAIMGHNASSSTSLTYNASDLLLVSPYIAVLTLALMGMNVLAVLVVGIIMCGAVGMSMHGMSITQFGESMANGMSGMQETIIVALLAGGLLSIIRHRGWIDSMIATLTRHTHSQRAGELAIASLVSITGFLTANNTVAILSVGNVAAELATRYGIDRRRSASILDTFSCIVQGILPYGAQILIAAGITGASHLAIISHLYYNMLLAAITLLAIIIRPRKILQTLDCE